MKAIIRFIIWSSGNLFALNALFAQVTYPQSELAFKLVNYDDDTLVLSGLYSDRDSLKIGVFLNQFSCKDCVHNTLAYLNETAIPYYVIIGGCQNYTSRKELLDYYGLKKATTYFDFDPVLFGTFVGTSRPTPVFAFLKLEKSPFILLKKEQEFVVYEYSKVFLKGTSEPDTGLFR